MEFQHLASPQIITEHRWPEGTIPLVSICCVTYNHAAFITEAIEGILMQETTFPVEILINDDASKDETGYILRNYEQRFPNLIRIFIQKENQYSKGNRAFPFLVSHARGKFIAFCEGDDIWNSPDKLEAQANYLNKHSSVVLSFHDVVSINENGEQLNDSKIRSIMGEQPHHLSTIEEISAALIPPLSMMFRNLPWQVGPRGRRVTNEDTYFFAMISKHGEMHNIGKIMGAHRRHAGGVWSGINEADKRRASFRTRIAIAREIERERCLLPCLQLAKSGWFGFVTAIRNREANPFIFLGGYLISLVWTVRFIVSESGNIRCFFRTEIQILSIPFRYLAAISRNAFLKITKPNQSPKKI